MSIGADVAAIVAALNANTAQQAVTAAKLDAVLQAIQGGAGAPGAGVAPQASLNQALDPNVLNRLLMVARFLGKVQGSLMSVTIDVPGNGVPVDFIFTPPAGYVLLYVSDTLLSTTYASAALLVDILIDGEDVTPPPAEFALVNAQQLANPGQFYYLENELKATLTNGSGVDAQVTMQASIAFIDADYFHHQFYLPLIQADIERMEALVAAAQGAGS